MLPFSLVSKKSHCFDKHCQISYKGLTNSWGWMSHQLKYLNLSFVRDSESNKKWFAVSSALLHLLYIASTAFPILCRCPYSWHYSAQVLISSLSDFFLLSTVYVLWFCQLLQWVHVIWIFIPVLHVFLLSPFLNCFPYIVHCITALEEPWLSSNEDFFIYLNLVIFIFH